MPALKNLRALLLLPAALLTGCDMVLLNPSGAVAAEQGHLIVVATVLMLLIVVPVMGLIVLFAWRYRDANSRATYAPDWDHSTQLELLIWAAPLLIIIALGAVTWISTHTLDPYRPLQRLDARRPVAAKTQPLTVEVVALDW
jgi:cytochrome o ubiquinol oxidase subunit 2